MILLFFDPWEDEVYGGDCHAHLSFSLVPYGYGPSANFSVDDPQFDVNPKPTTLPSAGSEPEPRMDGDW